jgi:competence protein ComEC
MRRKASLVVALLALGILLLVYWFYGSPTGTLPTPTTEATLASTGQLTPVSSRSVAGQPLTVLFLDVGQGDATLIRSPGGHIMLIDGGRSQDVAANVILPALKKLGAQQIDMMVATHPDQDHIGGLSYVIESVPVSHIVLTGQLHTTNTYERLLTLIRDKKIPAIKARGGGTLDFDPAVTTAILGPNDEQVKKDDTNNASVVIRMTYGAVSMIFTGDAEAPEEESILATGVDVRAQILKVSHHGSSTASSLPWLKAVSPKAVFISVGAGNPYGHPDAQVLRRMSGMSATIYRTDKQGTITLQTDGKTYQVLTERKG